MQSLKDVISVLKDKKNYRMNMLVILKINFLINLKKILKMVCKIPSIS